MKLLQPPVPLTPAQQAGRDFYSGSRRSDGIPVIDGLGHEQLAAHPHDAPFLHEHLGTPATVGVPSTTAASLTSFGQDNAGELYAVSHAGTIYRLTP